MHPRAPELAALQSTNRSQQKLPSGTPGRELGVQSFRVRWVQEFSNPNKATLLWAQSERSLECQLELGCSSGGQVGSLR